MKTHIRALVCIAMAIGCAVPATAEAMEPVRFAPVQRAHPLPRLDRKQGWLTITNRDWQDYYLEIGDKDKLFLHRDQIPGRRGMLIRSGNTVTIALDKETYDLYGETSDRLRVRVREGRTTTLSLEPFGYNRNSGLIGAVNDGDQVRKETLFNTYSAPVIVPAPPPVVIERPAPPPVIIHRPPPVVVVPNRPPPPRRNDGWGFFFGGDSGRRR